MSKELDAWKKIKQDALYHIQSVHMVGFNRQEEIQKEKKRISIIETALKNKECDKKKLKAFEIIKEKEVNVQWLLCCYTVENYNNGFFKGKKDLIKEEFDFLKETLA